VVIRTLLKQPGPVWTTTSKHCAYLCY